MVLDVAAACPAVVLELAARRAERIAQRYVRVLVRGRCRVRTTDRDDLIGERDVDMEVVQRAVSAVTRRWCHDHVTVRDARIEFLEPRHERADTVGERG